MIIHFITQTYKKTFFHLVKRAICLVQQSLNNWQVPFILTCRPEPSPSWSLYSCSCGLPQPGIESCAVHNGWHFPIQLFLWNSVHEHQPRPNAPSPLLLVPQSSALRCYGTLPWCVLSPENVNWQWTTANGLIVCSTSWPGRTQGYYISHSTPNIGPLYPWLLPDCVWPLQVNQILRNLARNGQTRAYIFDCFPEGP